MAATLASRVRAADQEAADAESSASGQVYPTLLAFVDAVIRPHYRRAVDNPEHNWCPQWWLHGEAFRRLDALWRAWEHLRKDPQTGMSVWWKDHADHHMGKLLDPIGPFAKCSARHGHKDTLPPLPAIAPNPALFDTPADPTDTGNDAGTDTDTDTDTDTEGASR
ncbi:DUF4913 domain-containing protein [Rhodococcus kroppenstedtii]|nr:DUF4913 domain-containing protein [Rhodococcus kroppenstedtii]